MGATKVVMLMAARDSFRNSTATHLRSLQFVSSYHTTRLVPQPPDLIHWVRREGGFVHQDLRISDGDSYGLGLVAAREIPRGSDLIALPNHIPLCLQSLDSEGDGPDAVIVQLARRVPEELWAMRLGLRLLQERAVVGSYWWPYISNLPEAFSVPIFFPGEDIKNLQYAPVVHQVNKRCRFLLDFEKEVRGSLQNIPSKSHPFGGQDVDASSLGWAMSAVSSRAFRLHGLHKGVPMMLPLIDMCNHSFHPNAQIIQAQDTSNSKMLVKVVADKLIEQGEPVMLNYGNLSNDFFLLDYGFVIPSNPHDHVELKYDGVLLDAASMAAGIASPTFSSPTEWQLQILSQLGLHGDGAILKVTLGGPELVEGRLLAALRVLLATEAETVQKHGLDTLKSLSVEAPLGVANEIAAFRTIIALCVIALGHFPTKIMEDESLLRQDVSSLRKLAVQFRIEKKTMIIDVMKELTKRVRLLQSNLKTTA
ncbi:hypothetical protein H6P81_015804 [Aristolochia fimbriata]|uniref:SET domain-containing protein n=1 Tax=Aristolochia fimbriata TaxID=158543 RepID=A0AAV7E788_ARIFI|nr:hypothetical protein H6P81_015804 [Aristolochia fimbriata]